MNSFSFEHCVPCLQKYPDPSGPITAKQRKKRLPSFVTPVTEMAHIFMQQVEELP